MALSLSIRTKKVVNRRVPKIAFSPLRNRVTRGYIFYDSVDVEVQWSSSFHPLSSVFEYEYKNATIHTHSVMDATPRECKEHAQSINSK